MSTVFDLFEEVPYTFLEISRGTVLGNEITNTYEAYGIFKQRSGMIQTNTQESRQATSTLHIHPDETFATDSMVGQGIRVDGHDYEITAQTGGRNFDDGELEHYTLTLQATDFAEYEGS